MQPVLTQVPPNSFRSMMATFMPAFDKRPASGGPACPVPMMIASNEVVISRLITIEQLQAGIDQWRSRFLLPLHLETLWTYLRFTASTIMVPGPTTAATEEEERPG